VETKISLDCLTKGVGEFLQQARKALLIRPPREQSKIGQCSQIRWWTVRGIYWPTNRYASFENRIDSTFKISRQGGRTFEKRSVLVHTSTLLETLKMRVSTLLTLARVSFTLNLKKREQVYSSAVASGPWTTLLAIIQLKNFPELSLHRTGTLHQARWQG